jgi:uncharacterized membrane protein YhaH (DUF805 family)
MNKYFNFSGTASRSEYWGVYILSIVLGMLFMTVGTGLLLTNNAAMLALGGLIFLAVVVGIIWVYLATAVRRCRNAGINPWWSAATFLPYVGVIVGIVIGCIPTTQAVTVDQ